MRWIKSGRRQVLYPIERVLIVVLLLLLGLSSHFGVALRRPSTLYLERVESAAIVYSVGLLISLLLLRLAALKEGRGGESYRQTWRSFRGQFLQPASLVRDVRLLQGVCASLVLFIELKHFIPVVNGALYDQWFVRAEHALFAGRTATEVLQGILGPWPASWLSSGYLLFYPYLACLVVFFALQRKDEAGRQQFFLAFALVWFLGLIIVYAVPTWGPCFFLPETTAALPVTEMTRLQQGLWAMKMALDENPNNLAAVFLISGFPSIHLALPLVASVLLQPLTAIGAVLSWCFVVVTAIATIYFGWHYLFDLLGALLLASVVLGLVSRKGPDVSAR